MSKRKFYRNFNKRKKVNGTRVVTVVICLGIVGGYAYINIKDKDFINNIGKFNLVASVKNAPIWDMFSNIFDKSKVITSSNIESELKNVKKEDSAKVVSVNDMLVYTIQVASLDNEKDLKKIEDVIAENKMPSSSMNIDNKGKIQAFMSFDENKVRENLEKTRTYFSDAFLTKIEVPMLSLEYTEEYKYMNDIAKNLNNLIENYQNESQYWDDNKTDLAEYNKILTNRKEILKNLKQNTEKIDYSKMNKFKNNLISFIDESENNILMASKNANENKLYISKGLLLSSIQQYYLFVQSMK